MTVQRHSAPAFSHRRAALFAMFFIPGVGIASWITRTPDIRDALEASTATMGLILFGLSAGSMTGILSSGPLSGRLGTKPVIAAGLGAIVFSTPTIGIGAVLQQPALVVLGLALFGLGMGGSEVAMNVEGADLESQSGRTLMPAMHGFFSLGTTFGATVGIICNSLQVPILGHLLAISMLTLVLFFFALARMGQGVQRHQASSEPSDDAPRSLWSDHVLVALGLIVLAMAFAEGTANDWLPLVMVDGHGVNAAWGSAFYALFAGAMTVGRFGGEWLLARVSRTRVVRGSALSGALGVALVAFVDNQAVAAAAVVFWGLGASLGFPLTLSAAGDSGKDSARRVSLVATLGFTAFLVGPPILGFVGDAYGLRQALILPMILLVAASFLSPAAARRGKAHDIASGHRTSWS